MDEQIVSFLLQYVPSVFVLLAACLVFWGRWSVKKIFMSQEDCQKCREDFDGRLISLDSQHKEREAAQAALKKTLDTLPTKEAIHSLALSIKGIEGGLGTLNERMAGQSRLLDNVNKTVDTLMAVHLEGGK